MSTPALSVSGLTFRYPGAAQAALDDLTLDIPAGSVTAILGPNGSGKSTLLRLLLGLLSPARGAIRVAGRPQRSYSRREMSQTIGLVPQDEHIPFDFSVMEYVLLGRAPHLGALEVPGERDRLAASAGLDAVGLAHLGHRAIPTLSGGERQLATLARALAQGPRILLLDEPSAHLDLGNISRLLDILRRLAHQGITLVLTTHDPNLAAAIADDAVLLRGGRLLAVGPVSAVLTAERLRATYGVPVEVVAVDGRQVILLP